MRSPPLVFLRSESSADARGASRPRKRLTAASRSDRGSTSCAEAGNGRAEELAAANKEEDEDDDEEKEEDEEEESVDEAAIAGGGAGGADVEEEATRTAGLTKEAGAALGAAGGELGAADEEEDQAPRAAGWELGSAVDGTDEACLSIADEACFSIAETHSGVSAPSLGSTVRSLCWLPPAASSSGSTVRSLSLPSSISMIRNTEKSGKNLLGDSARFTMSGHGHSHGGQECHGHG
jgi:hypothetical protein